MGSRFAFAAVWSWVMSSSIIDLAMTLSAIPNLHEENPFADWLLRTGGAGLLAAVKMAGTAVVGGVLIYLWNRHRRIAWPVVIGVAAFQSALIAYCLS